jgi:hypothetical protein
MANARSVLGTLTLDTAGGYTGPLFVKSIILQPTEAAGTYTFRASNSATGALLLFANNQTAGAIQIEVNMTIPGIYMNTGFPTGGKAVVLCG